jgi:hypothetical protein
VPVLSVTVANEIADGTIVMQQEILNADTSELDASRDLHDSDAPFRTQTAGAKDDR